MILLISFPALLLAPLLRFRPRRQEPPNGQFFRFIIVSTVALAGVERIDLLRGAGPIVLHPFLLLSPIVILTALWIHIHPEKRRAGETRAAKTGFMLLVCFLYTTMVGVFLSAQIVSASRWALLVIIAATGWAVVMIARRSGNTSSLRTGAAWGLAIYVALNCVQWVFFQRHGLTGPEFVGPLSVEIKPYGEGVVRLSGGSLDPNRAAATVATYTYILLGDPYLKIKRGLASSWGILLLGFALTLATISRSGILIFAFILLGSVVAIWRQQSRAQKTGSVILAAGLGIWAVTTDLLESLGMSDIAESRLDLSSGSASDHFYLLERGVDVVNANVYDIFFGSGWGTSYLFLQDVFAGNQYGNFHSLYITVLVESGIFALLIMCILVGRKIFSRRAWLALGVASFGVFYQSSSDPMFWIQIALLWGLPPLREKVQDQVPEVNGQVKQPKLIRRYTTERFESHRAKFDTTSTITTGRSV